MLTYRALERNINPVKSALLQNNEVSRGPPTAALATQSPIRYRDPAFSTAMWMYVHPAMVSEKLVVDRGSPG
jgi:hypothetical protein